MIKRIVKKSNLVYYCSRRDNFVIYFDDYCGFLGNCIAYHNDASFLSFLLFISIAILFNIIATNIKI